jgi:hypothetical protein
MSVIEGNSEVSTLREFFAGDLGPHSGPLATNKPDIATKKINKRGRTKAMRPPEPAAST